MLLCFNQSIDRFHAGYETRTEGPHLYSSGEGVGAGVGAGWVKPEITRGSRCGFTRGSKWGLTRGSQNGPTRPVGSRCSPLGAEAGGVGCGVGWGEGAGVGGASGCAVDPG